MTKHPPLNNRSLSHIRGFNYHPSFASHGIPRWIDLFDGNRWKNGNGFLFYEIAHGLDPSVPHLVEIEPVFDDTKAQELKLESLCVAGGQAILPPTLCGGKIRKRSAG
jgi:hypothetical protein